MDIIMLANEEKCEDILKKCLSSKKLSAEKAEEIRHHSLRVCKICEDIIKCMPINFKKSKKKRIYLSALFHDVGRVFGKKNHQHRALERLTDFFYEDKDLIKVHDIIKWHREEFDPSESQLIPAAILRAADKIDKMYKGEKKESYESLIESLDEIQKAYKKREVKGFKKFKKACKFVWMVNALWRPYEQLLRSVCQEDN